MRGKQASKPRRSAKRTSAKRTGRADTGSRERAMAGQIGRSTDPSTANNRDDVGGNECASFRYCNPGAQYPSERAARFGQTGYGMIGGGHKIARFPSPVNGAASNFDLLSRS